ncbi:MAG: hypothetical protein R3Y32_00215 [Bacillota bacterium]
MQAKRPIVKFTSSGASGNIYHILALCSRELQRRYRITDYNIMRDRIFESQSYREALAIAREYIDLIDVDGKY